MLKNMSKISIWITSTGRIDVLTSTIESFIDQCTYPNYEFVIVESQMTEESLKFFDISRIDQRKTEEYLQELPNKYPDVKFNIFIQPWKRLGAVYNQLLEHTEEYFVNLEDDAITVADPAPQFVDGMRMLQADHKLLGIRVDLRDDTVYEGSSRFQGTKEAAGIKFVHWDWCSGGAQFMDARKVRSIGRYYANHPVDKYGETEIDQTNKMRNACMYIGVSLKYYGFWVHISDTSIQGADRKWSCQLYEKLAERGWHGDGQFRQSL